MRQLSKKTKGKKPMKGDKKNTREDFLETPHPLSNIKKVVGVVSGKGGVGKSIVTSLAAVITERKGYKTAILDADITGPSIPKVFGITDKAKGDTEGILPEVTKSGIKIMSLNLLTKNESDPVIWRGPILGNSVKQFWTQVIWGDIDIMFIDMPPGTGDVPLTVFQSIPMDGIIVVTTPQELVTMIVKKAITMAKIMDISVLGIVENYSYTVCPHCKNKINIFGESKIAEKADEWGIKNYSEIPVYEEISSACDKGNIESQDIVLPENFTNMIDKIILEKL